jgi:hypothetical protein
LGGGAPGKAREGRPADANAIELGAGPPADAAGRLSEWPGSGALNRALQLAGLCSAARRRPPPRQLRDRQRLLIIRVPSLGMRPSAPIDPERGGLERSQDAGMVEGQMPSTGWSPISRTDSI